MKLQLLKIFKLLQSVSLAVSHLDEKRPTILLSPTTCFTITSAGLLIKSNICQIVEIKSDSDNKSALRTITINEKKN